MLRELRKRFVFIVMVCMFCIFFLLLFAINLFNFTNQQQKISRTMQTLVENNGELPLERAPHDSMRPEEPGRSHQDIEAPFMVRYCSVYLDEEYEIIRISTDRIAAISTQDAAAYTEEILDSGETSGQIAGYRFQLASQQDGYVLVLLDTSVEQRNILSLFVTSGIIGVGAYLLVFVLVVAISGRAVKPIAESYEKQKQFIADVSHELKTPLTVISADSEILAMTFGKNEWCDSIDKQTARMRHLISRMITLARMDGEEPAAEQTEFSLSEAVYDTAMAFEPLAKRCGKRFTVQVSPDILYTGSEAELRQCVSILLDNAVKYCDDGGEITVSLHREKHILLDVANTYRQAQSLDCRRLFDRFYRADQARSVGNSYGLGLSIARSILRRHHASITARPSGKESILFRVRF